MIWIHLSNIPHSTSFSGIVRTEYELSRYAYDCYKQGKEISFCTYDESLGFIAINPETVFRYLKALDHGYYLPTISSNLKRRMFRFKKSFLKRLNRLKGYFNSSNHCFNNGDVIISVGQRLNTTEMLTFAKIKKQVNIEVRLLIHDLMPINYSQFVVNENVYLFQKYLNEAILALDFIYCNSEYTKHEVIDYYNRVDAPLIPMEVVTLGCDFRKDFNPKNMTKLWGSDYLCICVVGVVGWCGANYIKGCGGLARWDYAQCKMREIDDF